MTPRQFYERYGQPIVRDVLVQPTATSVLPIDADRYAIIFVATAAGIQLMPSRDISALNPGIQFDASARLEFTHDRHGAIVGCEWFAIALGADTPMRIITASMPDLGIDSLPSIVVEHMRPKERQTIRDYLTKVFRRKDA